MADSAYMRQVKRISNAFETLEKRAGNILFPNQRKGIFVRPDINRWNNFTKFLYRLSHPYSVEKSPDLLDLVSLPILSILAWVTFLMAFGMIYASTVSMINPSVYSKTTEYVLYYLFWGIGILLSIVSYYWWLEGMRSNRYRPQTKLFVGIIFIAGMILISSAFKQIGAQKISLLTVLIYIFLVIPTLTYFYAIAIDGLVEAFYVIITIVRSIDSLHNPIQIENISTLLIDEQRLNGKDDRTWNMFDLLQSEIDTLQQWSQANRDATVNRIVPTSVIITILTLIGVSNVVSNWVDATIQNALSVFSKFLANPLSDAFLPAIGISLILLFVMWFLKTLARLFRNIAVQNLIIETCIVAKNARKEIDTSKKLESNISLESIFTWIGKLIAKL